MCLLLMTINIKYTVSTAIEYQSSVFVKLFSLYKLYICNDHKTTFLARDSV